MKYIDNLFWPTEKPDEKEFKESVICFLCEHFCHEDITIILTRDAEKLPVYGSNVVVFFSGNEASFIPQYHEYVGVIYTDFWNPGMPKNIKNIPLGTNERTSGRFITQEKIIPISERELDFCFVGCRHSHSAVSHRSIMFNAIEKIDPSLKKIVSGYEGFFYQPHIDKQQITDKKQQYIDLLNNTKISLCPGGNASIGDGYFPGWETYRFSESMRSGNIIICNYDWSPWYKGPNVFYIDHWSKLTTEFIRDILAKDLNSIQKQGIQYYRESISRFNILKSIVNDIERLVGLIKNKK